MEQKSVQSVQSVGEKNCLPMGKQLVLPTANNKKAHQNALFSCIFKKKVVPLQRILEKGCEYGSNYIKL